MVAAYGLTREEPADMSSVTPDLLILLLRVNGTFVSLCGMVKNWDELLLPMPTAVFPAWISAFLLIYSTESMERRASATISPRDMYL